MKNMKTKRYGSIDSAISWASFHLGFRNWDRVEDQDRAVCWVDVVSATKAAEIRPAKKGYKLTWDPQYERRRPKMIGM